MIKKNTIFDYLSSIMIIFSVSIISISFFAYIFGAEGTKDVSSIFSMGNQGISIATITQFFILSIIIATLKYIF